jgi:hypothetical protein
MPEPTHEIMAADPDEKDGVRFWRAYWIGHISLAKEFVTFEEAGGHIGVYSEETYQSRIAPRSRESWTMEEILDLPTYRP